MGSVAVGSIGVVVVVDSIGVAVGNIAAVAEADNIVGFVEERILWNQTRNLVVEHLGGNTDLNMGAG